MAVVPNRLVAFCYAALFFSYFYFLKRKVHEKYNVKKVSLVNYTKLN